jgi:hypothetical protein
MMLTSNSTNKQTNNPADSHFLCELCLCSDIILRFNEHLGGGGGGFCFHSFLYRYLRHGHANSSLQRETETAGLHGAAPGLILKGGNSIGATFVSLTGLAGFINFM